MEDKNNENLPKSIPDIADVGQLMETQITKTKYFFFVLIGQFILFLYIILLDLNTEQRFHNYCGDGKASNGNLKPYTEKFSKSVMTVECMCAAF